MSDHIDTKRQRVNCILGSHRQYAAGDREAIIDAVTDLLTVAQAEGFDPGAITRMAEAHRTGEAEELTEELGDSAESEQTAHRDDMPTFTYTVIGVHQYDYECFVETYEDINPGGAQDQARAALAPMPDSEPIVIAAVIKGLVEVAK